MSFAYMTLAVCLNVNSLVSINEVTLRWARLVLKSMTVCGLLVGKPSRYVTSDPGELSLAIPPRVGATSTCELWGEGLMCVIGVVVYLCQLHCGSSCSVLQTIFIGYNIVWSGLCECNERHPLQTCCNLIISWWLCTG